MTRSNRPDVVPIYEAVDRAMLDELDKWTYDVPDELRMALARHIVKDLQQASMLNFDRPWETDSRFVDIALRSDAGVAGAFRDVIPKEPT